MPSGYAFTTPLADFQPVMYPTPGVSGDVLIRTTAPLTWSEWDATGLVRLFTVPAGFLCDGASIPRRMWAWIGHPLSGRFVRAATLHDWGYRFPNGETRAEIDTRFRRGLDVDGVSGLRRLAMYLGVRAGGWIAWNRYRALDTE